MVSLIVAALIAVSVAAATYLLLNAFRGEGAIEGRVEDRLEKLFKRRQPAASLVNRPQFSQISKVDSLLQRQTFSHSLHHLLTLTGMKIPVSVFLLVDLVAASMIFMIVNFLSNSYFLAVPAAVLMVVVPYFILIVNRKRYLEKFTTSFPDALLMMKSALGSGQGMQAAFQLVAQEGPHPVSMEFQQMVREIELGATLDGALDSFYHRIPTVDFHLFVISINIQNEVGGNLVELFDRIEKTIRDRLSLGREVKVLSAQGQMSGIVLMLLPVFVFAAIKLTAPQYFDPLLQQELGKKILTLAIILQVIGSLIIRRITQYSFI